MNLRFYTIKGRPSIFAILLAAVLFGSFQNCTRSNTQNFTSDGSTQLNPSSIATPTPVGSIGPSQNNGYGYGGKVFVRLKANGELCTDGSRIESRIEVTAQEQGVRHRADCQNIGALSISLSPDRARFTVFSSSSGQSIQALVYENLIHQDESAPFFDLGLGYFCYNTTPHSGGRYVESFSLTYVLLLPIYMGSMMVRDDTTSSLRSVNLPVLTVASSSPSLLELDGDFDGAEYEVKISRDQNPITGSIDYSKDSENFSSSSMICVGNN